MQSNRVWASVTLAAIVVAIGVNYLVGASSGGEGPSVGEVSDKYETLVTPASYAFSIWGLIYTGLVAFGVYQVLPAQRDNPRFRAVRPWVVANMLFNAAWIVVFTAEKITLSTLIIAGMLLTLVFIHGGLEIGRRTVPPAEIWTARVPFSIYFGWITVATIVNVAISLLNAGWDGGGIRSEMWALALLAMGLTIGVFLHARFRNAWFLLTLAWAFGGIAVKQAGVDLVPGAATMAAFAALLAILARWVPALSPVNSGS
jgi:tryptophan-rich sensory protein